MNSLVALLIGLMTGAAMSVAVSCAWCVMHLPARLQDRFQAGSPRLYTWAIAAGLLLSALQTGADFSLSLPAWCAVPFFLAGGMFVGMLASALGEILEVVPVIIRRFHLGDVSAGMRITLMIGKGVGAILACLAFTL